MRSDARPLLSRPYLYYCSASSPDIPIPPQSGVLLRSYAHFHSSPHLFPPSLPPSSCRLAQASAAVVGRKEGGRILILIQCPAGEGEREKRMMRKKKEKPFLSFSPPPPCWFCCLPSFSFLGVRGPQRRNKERPPSSFSSSFSASAATDGDDDDCGLPAPKKKKAKGVLRDSTTSFSLMWECVDRQKLELSLDQLMPLRFMLAAEG